MRISIFSHNVEAAQFDYHLPRESIAQVPAERRDQSRLLLVNRSTGQVADHLFRELPDLFPQPVTCFKNTVSVLKARIFAERAGGGSVECLLLNPVDPSSATRWWCLLRPGKRLPVGSVFSSGDAFSATVLEKNEEGMALVEFDLKQHASVTQLADALGEMPLPPYIKREENDPRKVDDMERYQTVYADPDKPHAAAAPTAGLHFTPNVIERMRAGGIQFEELTLHVGLGTFKPIQTEQVESHVMHEEYYEIPEQTRRALQARDGRLKLAVGTTSLRAMEDFYRYSRKNKVPSSGVFSKNADIFIYPPDVFSTDALLTNFHLPRSTLLCLVSAFLTPGSTDGISWLKQLYNAALRRGYRFYSYGDAMLIL
jgi:S-adenosylmethionine:tRNA ribosyltransferase-isomerase